jgi:prepilin-type processing-associated H-X9-DG protein
MNFEDRTAAGYGACDSATGTALIYTLIYMELRFIVRP